jgi:glycosyltransferase involved in cell wall biosynthesis
MIVKNEENSIGECLKRLRNVVDEIIVVDTGSNDNTKEIAKEYTNRIFDFEWCNDFSKARNFSIEKASNDWILIIDSDEFLVDFKLDSLEKLFVNPKAVGRIERINYFDDSNTVKKYIERVNRVFNRNFFRYEGTIHEQIVSIEKDDLRTELIDVVVDHIGYTEDVVKRTNKINRNIEMLKTSLQIQGEDPYIYYQLGKSYYMQKEYINAVGAFESALEFDINIGLEYVEDLVETYGYALLNSRLYSKALELVELRGIFIDSCDFLFLAALIYMNNGYISEAVKCYNRCTEYKKCKVEGVNSYMAYYNLGVIYECLNDLSKAMYFYEKCGEYNHASNRLKHISDTLNSKSF